MSEANPPVPTRDPETGRFLTSGNPAGRPPGSRNRANLVKEFIEEKLTNELEEEAVQILHVAVRKAKAGDNAMIKLLLGDMLSAVRSGAASSDEGEDTGISIRIRNLTVNSQGTPQGVTIDQEDIEDA